MTTLTLSRFCLPATRKALMLLLFACSLVPTATCAQPAATPKSVLPIRPPAAHPPKAQQEHLAQWMDRHRSLPLDQQKSALEREPGFRELPLQTQQRMRDRLSELNAMPEEQRRRLLERTEAMEQLSPAQRQQVRGAMGQLGTLPVDRRRLVARAFRDMREMPATQRESVLTSDRFRSEFSDGERSTLANLLAVEPYLPAKKGAEPSEPGK